MSPNSTSRISVANQTCPVVSYPEGYKGQPLLPEFFFSAELPSVPHIYQDFFSLLLIEFAKKLDCGNTASSREYLNSLQSGETYFWNHDKLPEVFLVSTLKKHGKFTQRVLNIMPRNLIYELYPSYLLYASTKIQAGKNPALTGNKKNLGARLYRPCNDESCQVKR